MLRDMFKKTYTLIDSKYKTPDKADEPNIPAGLWRKCNKCGQPIYAEDVRSNFYICPKCKGYFRVHAYRRIEMTADAGSFEEWDKEMEFANPLDFPGYEKKIEAAREKTKLNEAIVTGKCTIGGEPAVIGVCDARFIMSSMGHVVGEKIARAVERATKEQLPVVIFACSGGARMQEGIVSLMQMAKTSAALKRHHKAGQDKRMTEARWMLYAKKADFDRIAEQYHISPVTARIIRNRGLEDMEDIGRYLYGSVEQLHDPRLLPDMDRAVEILGEKAAEGRRIRIVGDYDIDGVCSTYLLYRALKRIGAEVDYEIPDRIKDGYGINELIIEAAAEDGIDTILTCDNGIAAISQIARAKELGMTVVVTDHHDILTEAGETPEGREILPPADAVVNPKRRDSLYPFPDICGGMVAYKLVQVLYEVHKVPREEWLSLLEIAAIATVGDVMKLQGENRILVKEGLSRLGHTSNLGLRKLIEKNNLQAGTITAYHIGFVIGPCLNASGRLQTAKIALGLLLCEDEGEADRMAEELKALNDQRKDMTQEGIEQAAAMVDELYREDKVLVVFLPDCHESLAGIVAGRLRERYNKPSYVLTRAEGCVKGSGRSIEAYHMFQSLVEVQDLLLKFGGHPMAAGFSLEEKDVDEFRRRLNENARERLTEEDFIPKVWIDVAMPFEYITEPFIEELELLEPYGQGNEKPQFAQKGLFIRSARVMGRNRNVVRISLVNDRGTAMDGVIFTDGDLFMEEKGDCRVMDIIYYPGINEYNGNRNLQIVVKNWKFH